MPLYAKSTINSKCKITVKPTLLVLGVDANGLFNNVGNVLEINWVCDAMSN